MSIRLIGKIGRISGLLLATASVLSAQTVHLTGTIHERGIKSGIPGASLHILGTSRGARTNADGKFRLSLDRGTTYAIQIAAIGYRPDTLNLTLYQDSSENIALAVSPILGRPVTVSAMSTREEARRIMHKVIDSKDAWQSQINDYKFQAYSRGDVRVGKDTLKNIVAILESVANGYWERGKGYAEEITARHETADIPSEVNRIALFDVDNFYNDRIQVEDYNVVSPVAHDAFSRYDYDLLGEGTLNGVDVWKISAEPLSNLFPAFSGTLWIDKTDYTIVYLDLSPNDAIHIAPLKDVHFEQTFSFVDNKYWMPSDINFRLDVKFQLPIVPLIQFSQEATLQNYVINSGLPDSLFLHGTHTVAARADSVDSIHWVAMRTIPLTYAEDTTYREIDSVMKVADSLDAHPSPPSFDPLSLAFDFLSTDLYQYNRVEGSHFQIEHEWQLTKSRPLTLDASAGYGVGDARWKYSVGFTQALTMRPADKLTIQIPLGGDIRFGSAELPKQVSTSISGRIYDEYVPRSTEYSPIENTLTALLLHSDYPDYYRARGFDVEYSYMPSRNLSATLKFTNEDEISIPNVTNFSLLDPRDTFRLNPAIDEGRLHELTLQANAEYKNIAENTELHYSSSGIGSEFNYLWLGVNATIEGSLGGWGKAHLFLSERELLSGVLPTQSLFFIEGRNAVLAPSDVFRTVSPFEFQGDHLAEIMFEQNFYDLPTRALGINMPQDLHWLGFANMALVDEQVIEAGFGIGNILNLLRVDATWRITPRIEHNFFVTGTVAFSL